MRSVSNISVGCFRDLERCITCSRCSACKCPLFHGFAHLRSIMISHNVTNTIRYAYILNKQDQTRFPLLSWCYPAAQEQWPLNRTHTETLIRPSDRSNKINMTRPDSGIPYPSLLGRWIKCESMQDVSWGLGPSCFRSHCHKHSDYCALHLYQTHECK